jgi:hypothetical protein
MVCNKVVCSKVVCSKVVCSRVVYVAMYTHTWVCVRAHTLALSHTLSYARKCTHAYSTHHTNRCEWKG